MSERLKLGDLRKWTVVKSKIEWPMGSNVMNFVISNEFLCMYGHWSLRVEHLALQTWQILTMKVVMTSTLIFDEKGFGGASTVTNGRPSTSRGDERGTKCENQD